MHNLKVYSPYDRRQIDEIPLLNEQEVHQALLKAVSLFNDQKRHLPRYKRIEILEKTLLVLSQQQEQIIQIAAAEGGKPLIDTRIEMSRALQGIKIAIAEMQIQSGKQIPMDLTAAGDHRIAFTTREPRGVVFAISAFNHPINLIIHQIIPAIATGCPVLIKPASTTPRTCLTIVGALYAAGLPPEWCQPLICTSQIAEQLAANSSLGFLSFIGSAAVGWHLRSQLAPGVTCALEHGGVAPVILAADADIEDALPLLAKGSYYHAGQVCVSVQRIYVETSIIKSFTNLFVNLVKNLKVGDPLINGTEVGPLINPQEVLRIDSWIKEAVDGGAQILCGGHAISETCYAPTVVLNPPQNCQLSRLEVFGPVVCIYEYNNINDAIRSANQLPYCFQSAVFTQQINNALNIAQQLDANTVLINDHTAFRVDWMPFGGRKQSGLSVGGIPYTMHDMTYEKLWAIRCPEIRGV